MRRMLVTGGCGFIGSNFIRMALDRAAAGRLVNLDKLTYAGNLANLADKADDPRYRFARGDICDGDLVSILFEEERIDTVVHFAAESHVDRSISGPAEFIKTNVFGTFSLLEAARRAWIDAPSGTRAASKAKNLFLHVSTDEVYGSLGETGSFTEKTPYDPRSPYSASKAASDHLARSYHHTYGLPVIVANCSNNYGPYQFPEKLIPLVINNALAGLELPVYGDGKNVRDWLHVSDHCEAILTVLEKGRVGETYNIGGGCERRNIEVVRLICEIVDELADPLESGASRASLIRFVPDRPGHDRRYSIDAGKIRRELGWRPEVTFERGIRETVHWYLENRAWCEVAVDESRRRGSVARELQETE